MNEKAEFAVRVLKQYALENQVPARSTSDLSPMEQWLILRLLAVIKSLPDSDEIMKKVFKVADIRELERKVALGEISYSRMVEEMNERSYLAYSSSTMKDKDEPRCFKCNELLVDSMIGENPIYICPKCKWWINIEEYNLMKKYYDKKRD